MVSACLACVLDDSARLQIDVHRARSIWVVLRASTLDVIYWTVYSYLALCLVMPIWYNARVCLIKLLGTALFFLCFLLLACVLLALACHHQQQSTALTGPNTHGWGHLRPSDEHPRPTICTAYSLPSHSRHSRSTAKARDRAGIHTNSR